MKNLLLILLLIFSTFVSQINAQNETYPSTVSVSMGQSFLGIIIKAVNLSTSADISLSPAIEVAYDHSIENWLSVGGAVTYQRVKLDFDTRNFTNENNELISEKLRTKLSRTAISGRGLFHYGKDEDLDMYSGVRLGISVWSVGGDISADPNFDDGLDFSGVNLHFSVVAFGLRYYFTDNIAAAFEVNLGAPYFGKIGVAGRF